MLTKELLVSQQQPEKDCSENKFTRTDLPGISGLLICCFSMAEALHIAIAWFILLLWLLESDMMIDDVVRLLQFQNDLVLSLDIDCRLYSYLLGSTRTFLFFLALYKLLEHDDSNPTDWVFHN